MWLIGTVIERSPRGQRGTEDHLADQSALERVAKGEHAAIADIYDRHVKPVYSLALRILQDAADAEDIVQEVFVQAWRQAASYDVARGPVAAWLLTLTRSRAIDRLRARRARLDRVSAEQAATPTEAPSAAPDIQMVSREQVAQVRAALAELPLVQRIAVELAFYEGLTHAEIAAKLEQPLGTVKTRIRSAMLKLRDALTGTLAS